MWLTTENGYASVVWNPRRRRYAVRFRDIESAKRFAYLAQVWPDQIVTTEDRDYRYRFFLTKRGWKRLMSRLADFDYTNFKDHCHSADTPWHGHMGTILYRIYNAAWDIDSRPARYTSTTPTTGTDEDYAAYDAWEDSWAEPTIEGEWAKYYDDRQQR